MRVLYDNLHKLSYKLNFCMVLIETQDRQSLYRPLSCGKPELRRLRFSFLYSLVKELNRQLNAKNRKKSSML